MNKEPWLLEYTPWKTKSAFFNYIRGGLRRAVWKNHPVKLEFMKQARIRVPLGKITERNPEGLVYGFKCEICEEEFKAADCEVDHLDPTGQLQTEEDLKDFIVRLSFVDFNDLRILCKPCHTIVTHSQRFNLTFEEAKLDKQRIAFFNNNSVEEQKSILEGWGATTEEVSNAANRKEAFYKYFKGELNE